MIDDIGLEYYSKKRNAKVWYKDRMIDYPIQMHIWQMEPEDTDRCLNGVIEAQEKMTKDPENYKEWVQKYFGEGLCDIFMIPYNEKLWGVDL